MKPILFVILCLSCSAIDYRDESYDQIRIYEYIDYTDMTFLKFNIDYPSTIANWSLNIEMNGKCSKDLQYLHLYVNREYFVFHSLICVRCSHLQYQAYPLVAPRNESFPDLYIPTRHNLITNVFNRTEMNQFVQVNNPLQGTWFAMVR